MSVFRKGNKIYIVHKDVLETYEHFIDRGNFIASQNIDPMEEEEYEKVVLYSKIYVNNKYLGCEYHNQIMKELNRMIMGCP
jgi:hypothetical protein